MRIVTHNMLKCNVKGVEHGYPLRIEPEKVEIIECEYNEELVQKLMKKTQLHALKAAALNLEIEASWLKASDITVDSILTNADMLKEMHHLLFEVHVLEGHLICPESGRRFPIKDGIPNMLLHEDEV